MPRRCPARSASSPLIFRLRGSRDQMVQMGGEQAGDVLNRVTVRTEVVRQGVGDCGRSGRLIPPSCAPTIARA